MNRIAAGLLLAALVAGAALALEPDWTPPASAQGSGAALPVRPVWVSLLPSLRDANLFASGGSDGNWFVGYNTCWIVRLPAAPPGTYARAFLGARLGRSKTEPVPGSPPWVRRPIQGEIHIAVAPEPVWPESRRFKLVETGDIPEEGDAENASRNVGEARWFWTEVPLSVVSFEGENYLALYSPSPALADAAASPILAAGRREDAPGGVWLNSASRGQPPLTEAEALQTQIPNFVPALALKLVPASDRTVAVRAFWADPGPGPELVVEASVMGQDVEQAWLEISEDDGLTWARSGRPLWDPPYLFSHPLPSGRADLLLRVSAADLWGNRGTSAPLAVRDGQKRFGPP